MQKKVIANIFCWLGVINNLDIRINIIIFHFSDSLASVKSSRHVPTLSEVRNTLELPDSSFFCR